MINRIIISLCMDAFILEIMSIRQLMPTLTVGLLTQKKAQARRERYTRAPPALLNTISGKRTEKTISLSDCPRPRLPKRLHPTGRE